MYKTLRGLVVIICFITLLLLLYFQWNNFHEYLTSPNSVDNNSKVTQKIEIVHDKDYLSIKQTIYNVLNQTYELIFPEIGKEFICDSNKDSTTCAASYNVTNGELEIQYKINMDSNNQSFLLNDWFVHIKNLNNIKTTVHISEDSAIGGFWASNGINSYHDRLESLNYFVFKGDSGNLTMYWQKEPLTYVLKDEIVPIYSSDPMSALEISFHFMNINYSKNRAIPTVIMTDQTNPVSTGTLLFVSPYESSQNILSMWVKSFISENIWTGKAEEQWGIDVLSAFIVNQNPSESKISQMVLQLDHHLTTEEKDEFISVILNSETTLENLSQIDEILGNVKNMKTTFFQDNVTTAYNVIELHFFVEKPFYIEGEYFSTSPVYIIDEEFYLPLQFIAEEMGYRFKRISDNEAYLMNSDHTLRFYEDKRYFVFNEEQYGLIEDQVPSSIKTIKNEFYIQEKLLNDLFGIKLYQLDEMFLVNKIE